jgi:8-oxo-dGTP pyrophosphatase MutT (NUDIX family)
MRLLFEMRPENFDLSSAKRLDRQAARAIVLNGDNILLLYTKRYNDYSFPGGGANGDEDLSSCLMRELSEETGAQDIRVLKEYGYVDEIRPHYKPEYDVIHMISHFFVCEIGEVLATTRLESYEIENGMEVRWINIHEAIAHNQSVIDSKDSSIGLSIQRETLVLKMIAKELLGSD